MRLLKCFRVLALIPVLMGQSFPHDAMQEYQRGQPQMRLLKCFRVLALIPVLMVQSSPHDAMQKY